MLVRCSLAAAAASRRNRTAPPSAAPRIMRNAAHGQCVCVALGDTHGANDHAQPTAAWTAFERHSDGILSWPCCCVHRSGPNAFLAPTPDSRRRLNAQKSVPRGAPNGTSGCHHATLHNHWSRRSLRRIAVTGNRQNRHTSSHEFHMMPPLVDGSLRNPPTHGLTTDAGAETRRRLRFNARCGKGLRPFQIDDVSLPDRRATGHKTPPADSRPSGPRVSESLRCSPRRVNASLRPPGRSYRLRTNLFANLGL
jgi:hypothetical protein